VRRDTSGPGNNHLSTSIELKRAQGGEPLTIVTIDQSATLPGLARIGLRWSTPNQLDVSYVGGDLVLQVAKVGELAIRAQPRLGH